MWLNQSQPVSIDTWSFGGGGGGEKEKKKVRALQRASTEATWITAPEVSAKAVNINDSYHPPPGLLQPGSLHFSSSALFKGRESCSEQERQYCWQESFFFSSLPLSPRPFTPSSPQSRLSVGGEITVDCTYRGFSRFFFFFLKAWLLSRQITGDQDQVPQSEGRTPPPPSRSSGVRTLLGESRRILVTWRGRRRGGTSPKRWTPDMLWRKHSSSFLHPIPSASPRRKELAAARVGKDQGLSAL